MSSVASSNPYRCIDEKTAAAVACKLAGFRENHEWPKIEAALRALEHYAIGRIVRCVDKGTYSGRPGNLLTELVSHLSNTTCHDRPELMHAALRTTRAIMELMLVKYKGTARPSSNDGDGFSNGTCEDLRAALHRVSGPAASTRRPGYLFELAFIQELLNGIQGGTSLREWGKDVMEATVKVYAEEGEVNSAMTVPLAGLISKYSSQLTHSWMQDALVLGWVGRACDQNAAQFAKVLNKMRCRSHMQIRFATVEVCRDLITRPDTSDQVVKLAFQELDHLAKETSLRVSLVLEEIIQHYSSRADQALQVWCQIPEPSEDAPTVWLCELLLKGADVPWPHKQAAISRLRTLSEHQSAKIRSSVKGALEFAMLKGGPAVAGEAVQIWKDMDAEPPIGRIYSEDDLLLCESVTEEVQSIVLTKVVGQLRARQSSVRQNARAMLEKVSRKGNEELALKAQHALASFNSRASPVALRRSPSNQQKRRSSLDPKVLFRGRGKQQDPQSLLVRAIADVEARKYERAFTVFNSLFADESVDPNVRCTAAFKIGSLYRDRHLDGSDREAIQWFECARDLGLHRASIELAKLLEKIPGQQEEVMQLLKDVWQNGERRDKGEAMFRIGKLHRAAEKHNEAVKCFKKAAAEDFGDAMFILGKIARDQGDQVKASEWYGKAEERYLKETGAEYRKARYMLGQICRDNKDTVSARRWYREAADAGHGDAMYMLGTIHESAKNLREAKKWYQRAGQADNGRYRPDASQAYQRLTAQS